MTGIGVALGGNPGKAWFDAVADSENEAAMLAAKHALKGNNGGNNRRPGKNSIKN